MAATGIKEVRHPHDAVMDYMLAHPFWTLAQLAAATGYTVPWLSQMIRSDCFQDEYHRRRADFETNVMGSIQERLGELSHLAISKMGQALEGTQDPDTIIDAFDKVLHRTGYAPRSQATSVPPSVLQQQNNVFLVEKGELAALRAVITSGGQGIQDVLPAPLDQEPNE